MAEGWKPNLCVGRACLCGFDYVLVSAARGGKDYDWRAQAGQTVDDDIVTKKLLMKTSHHRQSLRGAPDRALLNSTAVSARGKSPARRKTARDHIRPRSMAVLLIWPKLKESSLLVHFWAMWCGPCIAEIPNVKAAEINCTKRGFEIVGISFEKLQGQARKLSVKDKQMPWAQ